MKTLNIEIENCYGIKKLQQHFDFSNGKAYAIYAPNGSMKSSLAQTFRDVSEGKVSRDRIFPDRPTIRKITDDNGYDVSPGNVLVVPPYDEVLGHTEKTSTLLVDNKLRKEYEALHVKIDECKKNLLKALKQQSGSKRELDKEISLTFTSRDDDFYIALIRIKDEVVGQKDAPYANIEYDTIFDEAILTILATKDFKIAIDDYIKKYNELIAASSYFQKGIFNYYNAAEIAKSLASNGFFNAKHSVSLNNGGKLEITSEKQLEELVAKEKDSISKDPELRKKFAEIDKLLYKNAANRGFQTYLENHEEILPHLANVKYFKEQVWKSYLKARIDLYLELVAEYQATEKRKKEIEEEAGKQITLWQAVIDIFNARFYVPFKLEAKNRVSVILGDDRMLTLGFTFEDSDGTASVGKPELMQVLSTGEKKALYILNIIFEIEARKYAKQDTFFVVDDIADSFDYKNKYAIVQYLKDIEDVAHFNQIILTYNFDFFRTIQSRFPINYNKCLMASKRDSGIILEQANGIKNVFANDWKVNFYTDQKKRIACIPFMRNLIEYTKSTTDPDYLILTSLLHWKVTSQTITQGQLDAIFVNLFNITGQWPNSKNLVVNDILNSATGCLGDPEGINFENKIILSIAIRLTADRYMATKINNPEIVTSIESNQTPKLLSEFEKLFKSETKAIEILKRVSLMTPENIHLNSFMYEPILDMSDDHLRTLLKAVMDLA